MIGFTKRADRLRELLESIKPTISITYAECSVRMVDGLGAIDEIISDPHIVGIHAEDERLQEALCMLLDSETGKNTI